MKQKKPLPPDLFDLLEYNKEAFVIATTEEAVAPQRRRGADNASRILRILKVTKKDSQRFTEEQEEYLNSVISKLEEGGIPKQTAKKTRKALVDLDKEVTNPFKVLGVLKLNIPDALLESHYSENISPNQGKREVILSLYLTGAENE